MQTLINTTPAKTLERLRRSLFLKSITIIQPPRLRQQLATHFIRHTMQLSKMNRDRGLASYNTVSTKGVRLAHTFRIMRRQNEVHSRELVWMLHGEEKLPREEFLNDIVIIPVRVGFGIVDSLADVMRDIRSADELNSQIPALVSGKDEMFVHVLSRGFEVALDCVEDDSSSVAVEFSHQSDRPLVDCRLEDLLLGVYPETGTPARDLGAYFPHRCVDRCRRDGVTAR